MITHATLTNNDRKMGLVRVEIDPGLVDSYIYGGLNAQQRRDVLTAAVNAAAAALPSNYASLNADMFSATAEDITPA
ncbi:hypothetical protein CPT_Sycamore_019 [Streptomyces phage Sycamore]|uniref:Uncharacterized protein n=1 Tax=Streptomyces phage Sycamore TaxID=2767589 RepID=A0A873WDM1_9CAUD|nr:hypothetical protein CPT_Sycamore_019 [Streptomyces phage Sycamore]